MRSIPTAFVAVSSLVVLAGLANGQGGGEPPPTMTQDQVLQALKKALPFDIHGGVLLWYYQPTTDGAKDDTSIYYANLVLDAASGNWGFHFEPRFRDSKLRPFFNSNTWIQELYVSWKPSADCTGMLKAGKVYSQFGRFWDGVFYGNIPYFDGLKLDPDLGVSWEQKLELNDKTAVDYSLQYFTRDGSTNGSLQGRDTLSIGGTERDALVGRVAPSFMLGDETKLTVGVSGMAFEADLPAPTSDSDVTRANLEASLDVGKFTVFGDYTHQSGNHVIDFPLPGSSSDDINYLMSGVQYQWDDLTFRYSYSSADYKDEDVQEWLHLPGIVYQINPHVSLWLEYVYWGREEPLDDFIVDRSFNLILYAAF